MGPLFSKADQASKVVAYLKSGEEFFIHPKFLMKIIRLEFYPAITSAGIEGFIHHDHFITYNLSHETTKKLTKDNTNYLSKKSYSHGNYVKKLFGSSQFFSSPHPRVRSSIDYNHPIQTAKLVWHLEAAASICSNKVKRFKRYICWRNYFSSFSSKTH